MAKMRTIDGLFQAIHAADPGSSISRNFIRNLVISGKVKSVRAGNKYLIDYDVFLNYLASPAEVEEIKVGEYGKLRKIGG